MDKEKTIKLKDYYKLLRVLSRHYPEAALRISHCLNKHDGLKEILRYRVVLNYINENF
tara:strand:+ start:682 stop:855 length:174 start_codon:yes stop_codon:yes gene_type:complete